MVGVALAVAALAGEEEKGEVALAVEETCKAPG